jgi:hypothetical protein
MRKDGVLRPRPLREGIRVVVSDAAEGNRAEAGAAVAESHRAGDGHTVWSERMVAAPGPGTALAARCSAAGFHPDPVRSSGRRRDRTAASPRSRAMKVMRAARRGNSVSIGISWA